MASLFNLSILPAIIAAVTTYLFSPILINLGERLGIVDDPRKNKHPKVIHTYPVPRGGGTATFLGILVSSVFFLPLDAHFKAIMMGAFIIMALGVIDDKYNLSPYMRIFIQFVAAAIPITAGIGITFITNPFGGVLDLSQPSFQFNLFGKAREITILSDLFAVFWIVFMMNMLNMGAKGVDGQLPGVVAIAAFAIASISLGYSADIAQWPVAILASSVMGAYLGFLPWNFYPQKIMPGFSGSTLAGYFLAVLSILSTAKLGTLIVSLGVPIVDTAYAIVRRLASGKSPVWGDNEHLHHKLLDMGLTKRQVAILYWAATGLLYVLAINLNAENKFYTITGISLVIGCVMFWVTYKPKDSKP